MRGKTVIATAFLLATAAACFLPRIRVDAGSNVLVNEDDPDLAYYNITRPEWGTDEYAILCARRADWFTPESIQLLKDLTEELRQAPHVKSVTSILSVPLFRTRTALIPIPVFLTEGGLDLNLARQELLQHTQARGNLISEDARDLSLLVHLDVPESVNRLEPLWSRYQGEKAKQKLAEIEKDYDAALAELKTRRTAMVGEIRRIASARSAQMEGPIRLSGIPIINVNLIEHITADLKTFGLISLAFFTLAFLIVYRRPRWTILPIITCLFPVILIVGAMAMVGKKVTVITSNLPVLLFVLTLPYAVYLIERYRERRSLFPAEKDSVGGAARDMWIPCLYSAMTMMAGFGALVTSGINPVRTFGLMMTIGIAVGLAASFILFPSLLRALPARDETAAPSRPSGAVGILEKSVLRAPLAIVVFSIALLGLSVWGTTRIRVETKFIDYFWPRSEVYQGLEYIDTRMGGTTPLEIMLTSREPGYFKTEEGLEAIAAASSYFAGVPEAGNVRSLKTLVDEARKAIRGVTLDRLAKFKVAEGQIREFANKDYTTTRILVRFRETAPTLHRNRILKGLREHLAAEPKLKNLEARPTGVFLLYANMLNALIQSQKETFLIVVGAIFVMLLMLFRSPVLALLVLVPQVLPVLACLGVMGFTGIPLDLVTVMIASIAMGIGVDAAIQYTVRYRSERKSGHEPAAAITRSHATIGRAIWIATSIVVAGFAVLAFSKFVPSVTFGLFTALAMLMSQFAALTLLPALFLLFKR